MKKLLLVMFALSIGLYGFSQDRAITSKAIREVSVVKTKPVKGSESYNEVYSPGMKSASMLQEEVKIGNTWYDVGSNRSMQTRAYLHGDGTIGAVWTYGPEGNPSGVNRGTGYNYFDGNAWGELPSQAIETGAKAGWPSYSVWGETGEAYTCHDYYLGTILGTRVEKGTGAWNLVIQAGPAGAEDISFPRVMTTGVNRQLTHILSTTWVAYNGQTTALLYARTNDGGATWEVENQLFDLLGPDYYTEIGGDTYEFAETKNGTLAFLVGDNWTDLVLMKSEDEGGTWDKTVIWECPYPLWAVGQVTDTFYCPDGSHHLAFDNNGLVHTVFSLSRGLSDGATQSYFPGVDGVVYWNESMPSFTSNKNALNPYGHPDSELEDDVTLIGWSQDIDGDGTITLLDELATYNTGLSSHPQMVIDDQNRIFVIYSSITETFSNGVSNYRHIWARTSPDGGTSWGTFYDLTGTLLYTYDECVYPSISPTSDDENIYFTYQADNTPGTVTNSTDEIFIRFMSVVKEDIINGVSENNAIISDSKVSQNYPNPFSGSSNVLVMLDKPASLSLEVSNLLGQVVYSIQSRQYPAGKNELTIHASGLESGIYFYTVRSGENSVTKKMMIE